MIAIINRGGIDPDPQGLRTYQVQINNNPILFGQTVLFQHYRKDGMAVCLRKAADAIDRARDNIVEMLMEV